MGFDEANRAVGAAEQHLTDRERSPLSEGGYGREVREALSARADHLETTGLAARRNGRLVLQRDLLNTLRRRELDAVGAQLAAESTLPYQPISADEPLAGVYRRRLNLTSGRFAMIDNGLGFQLAPWTPALDQHLGRSVIGVPRNGGGIDWSLGRKRDLSL